MPLYDLLEGTVIAIVGREAITEYKGTKGVTATVSAMRIFL